MTNEQKKKLSAEYLAAMDGWIQDKRIKGAKESQARYLAAVKALQAAGIDPGDVYQDHRDQVAAERAASAARYEKRRAEVLAAYKRPTVAAVEEARQAWIKIAKGAGWYEDRAARDGGLYVHIWYGPDGSIIDSVYQPAGLKYDTLEAGREDIC